jgi:hypothetical protein
VNSERRDFPLDWPEDEYRSRREFVAFLMLISAAFVAGQLWILLIQTWRKAAGQPPRWPTSSKGDCFRERVGGRTVKALWISELGNRCILVWLSDTNFVAYGQKCTHLSCPVLPRPDLGRMYCPCHEDLVLDQIQADLSVKLSTSLPISFYLFDVRKGHGSNDCIALTIGSWLASKTFLPQRP